MTDEVKVEAVPAPSTVTVGGRDFVIGHPTIELYIRVIQFVTRLYSQGYQAAVLGLGVMAKAMASDMSDTFVILKGIEALKPEDVLSLSALLLQVPEAEGVAFIREHGWDPGWFIEALAVNAEQIEIGRIIKNVNRVAKAIQSQLAPKAT